ncbi:aminodeoxychorismate synthase [Pneumocystis murina B123]|uniref:aminodeoxychorismate synthase n=1 Tax=Pneumocystis murina (strain B123) TaxID=1069680 RepID=M7NPI2_PNEMU|nr:aminodeoxychorismate synthase [Pneumocystis murina B123]EMR09167.1 aminodeoxychorismate synthase [Pneumocystis murina B123]
MNPECCLFVDKISAIDWEGKILLIDAYDSYFYNVCSLIETVLPSAELFIIRHDQFDSVTLYEYIDGFDCCILGPGPGNPGNKKDIGLFSVVWSLKEEHVLPVFGICLGMQTLCLEWGGSLSRLKYVAHGIISEIQHTQQDLFEGFPEIFKVVRYHSFCVNINKSTVLEALAWTEDQNGKILMGVKHKNKPFYGVQYHPESFLSEHGEKIIYNFWKIVCEFNKKERRPRIVLNKRWNNLHQTIEPLGTIIEWDKTKNQEFDQKFNQKFNKKSDKKFNKKLDRHNESIPIFEDANKHETVFFEVLNIKISAVQLVEELYLEKKELCAILESTSEPGRYSIIGVPSEGHYTLTHTFPDMHLIKTYSDRQEKIPLDRPHIWTWLINNIHKLHVNNSSEVPFQGGFIGYFNYEYTIYTSNIYEKSKFKHPDVNLLFFERSIVIDVIKNQVVIQSLIENDPWVTKTAAIIRSFNNKYSNNSAFSQNSFNQNNHFQNILQTRIVLPDKNQYLKKIKIAKNYIKQGESYELCLTSTTRIFSSKKYTPIDDWNLYKHLRTLNPAPFSGYLRLNGVTLLLSSPERFLSWSSSGLCELRPIKGTLRKDPSIDLKKATDLLKNPKDYAENLMILDLIRNDLCQIAKNVHIPALMQVEEYQTVYQLVSVIRGTVQPPYTGIDVLAHTLPPGSMTGAPKKRSIELLRELEKKERDIYSGVFGYFSVCGGGDWSVIIRSTFRYHDEDHWNIGAGGAITSLSNPQNEWDEMILKLQSVLSLFK